MHIYHFPFKLKLVKVSPLGRVKFPGEGGPGVESSRDESSPELGGGGHGVHPGTGTNSFSPPPFTCFSGHLNASEKGVAKISFVLVVTMPFMGIA